ncbi:hypothetical protein WA026_010469 [Henosepilachna vigintioctopunctata]|uniref:Replication termination factor 2 n=1 Tax=Henosepilachna vigintioctopunctata TaxID=420089 RepID=A0AAW1VBK6_9CUCU
MGCDGGTIPKRDELVRTKKKPETKDKDSELVFHWRYCALTQQPLQNPIVICGLGKLYNKDALIESLLNRTTPKEINHVKSLKDVRELNLTPNPTFKGNDTKEKGPNIGTSPYICPVIGLEMSGKFRFVALWSCGCVFSERALKQINTSVCHKCQKPFCTDDVVIINAADEDLALMQERLCRRLLSQKKYKEKKIKIESDETVTSNPIGNDKKKTIKEEKNVPIMPIAGPSNGKKREGKLQESAIDTKKIKSEYSVAKDPQVSDVYKSLFTSHKSEKEQNRAHWVTYNPFYN